MTVVEYGDSECPTCKQAAPAVKIMFKRYPFESAGRKLETYIDWVAETFLVSLAALPAASVPAGLAASGVPVGLQIVGPRFSDPRLLACAKLVERDRPLGWAPHAA